MYLRIPLEQAIEANHKSKNYMRYFCLTAVTFLLGCLFSYHADAQTYEMYVGESRTLYAPSAPSGTTMHQVFWTPKGNEISVVPQGLCNERAEVTVDKYFTTATYVTCEYYYTDNGQYQYTHKQVKEFRIECKQVTLNPNPSYVKVKKGQTVHVSYSTSPSGKNPKVKWRSNGWSIAQVNDYGDITGTGIGETSVTLEQDMGPNCQVGVTVIAPDPDRVSVSPSSHEMHIGDTKQLRATVYPSDADDSVEWSVSWTDNYGAVSVSRSGLVTAYKGGSARIEARTSNGKTDYCDITVISKPTSVSISPSSLSLETGESKALTATVYPNGTETTLYWSSSNSSVASVTQSGKVTAKSAGTAYIKVETSNGLSDDCMVTVSSQPNSVKLSKSSASLKVDETLQLTATVSPSDATTSLSWKTSDSKVATVTQNGLVKGIDAGKATITVSTSNGKTAECEVTVSYVEPTSIKLSKTSASISVNETLQLSTTLTPNNATTTLSWKSGDEKIASVSEKGLVKGIDAGKTKITVSTSNGKSATCEVTVNPIPKSISLPETLSIPQGSKKSLEAVIEPKGATTTLTWSSSDTKIATVSSDGTVSAVSEGTATITVKTSNNLSAKCKVTVVAPVPPESIEIVNKEALVSVGYYVKFNYKLMPEDASAKLTWTTTDKDVATVSTTGLAKGVTEGTATITVTTDNGLTAEAEVSVVKTPELSDINITQKKITTLKALAVEASGYIK